MVMLAVLTLHPIYIWYTFHIHLKKNWPGSKSKDLWATASSADPLHSSSVAHRSYPAKALIDKIIKKPLFFHWFLHFSVPKSTLARHFTYIWYACGIHLKYVSNKFKVNLRSDSTEPLCEGWSPGGQVAKPITELARRDSFIHRKIHSMHSSHLIYIWYTSHIHIR